MRLTGTTSVPTQGKMPPKRVVYQATVIETYNEEHQNTYTGGPMGGVATISKLDTTSKLRASGFSSKALQLHKGDSIIRKQKHTNVSHQITLNIIGKVSPYSPPNMTVVLFATLLI